MHRTAANDRAARCPLCRETHAVTAADSVDEHGNALDADEAAMTAHYRLAVAARSAGPFALFTTDRAPCECERADDGALLYCAACLDAMDDGRDEVFTGAEYVNDLAPLDGP